MTRQDPSTDIENVNAAYRYQYELANHYRKALEEIANQDFRGNRSVESQIAYRALAFDPLSRERSS